MSASSTPARSSTSCRTRRGFLYEFRNLPEDDIEALVAEVEAHARTVLEPEMKRIDPEAGFAFQSASYIPPLDTAADAPVVSLAKRLAGRNDHAKVAYGTEAGQFASVAGIPAVVVGPGSISEAHIPDEWIEIAELDRTAAMIDRLIEACTSGML